MKVVERRNEYGLERHRLFQTREAELANARSEHELLARKLALIESRLLVGGENMLEKAEEQARLLQKSQDELEKSRRNQNQLKKAIEEKLAER
jgi:kinesin family protein 3/17